VFPLRWELAHFVRFFSGEILRLRTIVGEVVELPRRVLAGGDDLPIPGAQGAIAFVQKPDRVARDGHILLQRRHETLARIARRIRSAFVGERIPGHQLSVRRDTVRPVHHERRGNATFVHPGLCRRNGVFENVDQPGPRHRNVDQGFDRATATQDVWAL